MIKKIIYITILTCLCYTAKAQNNDKFKPEWNIGVGFGPTFSSVDFQTNTRANLSIETKSLQQYHGGVAIRYISENHLGFIAELNYSQMGWEQKFQQEQPQYANAQYRRKLNYVELPFLTHIYFGRKVRFFVNLGPKIGYIISESEEMDQSLEDYLSSGNIPSNVATYQYYREVEHKIDYGIMGGMGLEFRTGIGNFSLEGRYYYGLGDLFNNNKSAYFGRSANQIISARLTYFVKVF